MRRLITLFFLNSFVLLAASQQVRIPVGAVYNRLSSYTPRFSDAFSAAANQAALANLSSFNAGVYSERRFMLQELSLHQAAVAVPVHNGAFGLQGVYSGSTSYNESSLGLAYARKLSAKIDVGVQFNYQNLTVATYGTASAVNFEAGVLIHPLQNLHLGLHVYNPTSQKLGKEAEEKLPAVYTTGLGYEVSDKFFVAAEIQKQENQPLSVHAGAQYNFDPHLFARTGFSSATESFYLGLGVKLKDLRLDATASLHPQLGFTPGILLLYQSHKTKNEK